jgi:hypothetical protein
MIEDGGEVTPEVLARIDALEEDFERLVENYAKMIAGENWTATMLRQEAAVMVAKARAHEEAENRLKKALHDLLTLRGADRVATDLFVVAINKSPPSAAVKDGVTVDDLPEEYVRVTKAPNLQKILEDHRNGVPLPDGLVEVKTGNTHVKIRPR